MNTIKTVIKFAKGIFRLNKKKEYILKFNKEEDNCWYIDIPWDGNHGDLQMVAGADKLLDFLNPKHVKISCITTKEDTNISGYFKLRRFDCGLTSGAFYKVEGLDGFSREIWICPVTLCVLGEYPEYIHIKEIK